MNGHIGPYLSLKDWRDNHIENHQTNSNKLNHFHDKVMKDVFDTALNQMKEQWGPPPCQFSWFVLGSAGRFEQAIISDQDHGLIYETEKKEANDYFCKLGGEIALGLNTVGYPYCDGNVMSSNPLWCKSKEQWTAQLSKWLEEESFESVRFLLIFYDARVLVGEKEYINQLKRQIYDYIEEKPYFLERLLENTLHVKKAVGVFHQFLTETHGSHAGSIDLKHSGFFPFVNATRLLAIQEKADATSTLLRMDELIAATKNKHDMELFRADFEKLLHFRLSHHKIAAENYDDIHYLDVKDLDKFERKEIKHILRNGQKLQEYVKSFIKGTLQK